MLLLPLLLVNINLTMVHVVSVRLVILYFYFFSFIVKSSDSKTHGYILRAMEKAEGRMATHTMKMPVGNVHNITAKME